MRTAVKQAVEYARKKGKWITFDPNLRLSLWNTPDEAREQILWGLSQADVVKLSDEEAEFLWGITDEEKAAEKLQKESGVKLFMVTMGPRGAYLSNRKAAARVFCPRVTPVDTTGAGDIFGGSAVAWLLKNGKAPEELDEKELAAMALSRPQRPACPQKSPEESPVSPLRQRSLKSSGNQKPYKRGRCQAR